MENKKKIPLMGKVFDIAEEMRAKANEKTPFIKNNDKEKDVVYKTVNGEDIIMDIYTPKEKKFSPSPAVLIVPGGGWLIHNRKRRGGYASLFTQLGATVFVIDYRLSPDVKFPENVKDVVDAIDFIYDNSEKYNIDVNNVLITGDSAGGHLSACLACTATTPGYAERIDTRVPKIIPCGCIFISGAFSFKTMFRIPEAYNLIGKYFSGLKNKKEFIKWKYYEESTPWNFITKDFPKSYNSGGAGDLFCYGDAERMADKLTEVGVENEFFIGKGIHDDHCYVLRTPYKFARKDMDKILKWYIRLEKEHGVDMQKEFEEISLYIKNPKNKVIPKE